MSESVDKNQLKNILIPAAAVASVILVIGLILSGTSNPEKKDETPASPDASRVISKVTDDSDVGMTDAKPDTSAPDWKDIGEGLKIWDVKDGTGDMAKTSSLVNCHYSGWLTNGTLFDSSRKRGSPTEFGLDGVIKGWTKGIPGMKPGGIRRIYIPWALAYGAQGRAPTIPPKADLVFEVKLISIR